jgi:hypothetical protein
LSADVASGPENKPVVVSSEEFAGTINQVHLLRRELFLCVGLFYFEEVYQPVTLQEAGRKQWLRELYKNP